MNKRHRQLLAALQPATDYAMSRTRPTPERARRGLSMVTRINTDAAAELNIYGVIGGGGWFDDGVCASDVQAALQAIGPGPVNVRLNSPGGDVFDGVAIHSLLARHPGTVTVYVDGLAASAASFIMLAGDHIVSARNAFIMIHSAMTMTYGNPDTHRQAADLLDKVSDNIADMYAERAGEDAEYWRSVMDAKGEDGTWYTGQEALTAGLVDSLTAVPDDFDEPSAVADRLRVWSAVLPLAAREFISEHPVETDDDEDDIDVPLDDEPSAGTEDAAAPAESDQLIDEASRDWAFALAVAGLK